MKPEFGGGRGHPRQDKIAVGLTATPFYLTLDDLDTPKLCGVKYSD